MAAPDLRLRRLGRLARARSPRLVAGSLRREVTWRRAEAALARAARDGSPVLAGPFLGEVGYELLYWIPLLRRVLSEHGIGPERVTAVSRGGAGAWYGDLAASSVEVLDLVPPDRYLEQLTARRTREGHAKQLVVDPLDRELLRRAAEQSGPATAVHPLLMYSRLRFVWEGLLPPAEAVRRADYRRLALRPVPLPDDVPREYVAVKVYFSDSLPETGPSRAAASALVRGLARATDVVVLSSGVPLDEHVEWSAQGDRIHDAARWLRPRDNLAVQARLVAGASALVSTYGGFSYLGPFLGVPTVAVRARDAYNAYHLDVLRAAFPEAPYRHLRLGDADPVEAALESAEAVR